MSLELTCLFGLKGTDLALEYGMVGMQVTPHVDAVEGFVVTVSAREGFRHFQQFPVFQSFTLGFFYFFLF